MAVLLGLCVLLYCGTSNDVLITKDQSVLNNGADVVSIVKPHLAENALHKDVPPMNGGAWFIDHGDGEQVEVGHTTEPVSLGVYLDPDVDPAVFDAIQLHSQVNVGMSLDVDGEPSGLITSGVSSQQNEGEFLDADGNYDSYLDFGSEPKKVNIGEFIDPDDPILFL